MLLVSNEADILSGNILVSDALRKTNELAQVLKQDAQDEEETIHEESPIDKSIVHCAIASCDEEWIEHAAYCYYVSSTSATWYEADKNCTDMGAQLTSISNSNEHVFLYNFVFKAQEYYWIGLKRIFKCPVEYIWCSQDMSSTGQWSWTDNSSTSYINRFNFDTVRNCILINQAGKLEGLNCQNPNYYDGHYHDIYYICKIRKRSMISIPEVTTSSRKPLTSTELSPTDNRSLPITIVIECLQLQIAPAFLKHLFPNVTTRVFSTIKITPIAVVTVIIAIVAAVVIILVIVCKRRNAGRERQQQQQSIESNMCSRPPVAPSAPPLEILYDNHVERVRVQDGVLNPEYSREEENLSENGSYVNPQDDHVYTSLTKTSRSPTS
ncbi:hypothetical protein LSH36_569g01004 [Paralvinella palmiformis]|uniref:C-type lectin domain-containing protein n=1 Tax=Paralvinella palmiformis TaxID=53620 RepID=A0AAD9MXZ5_9ANNE|nr:hypothetical protein LSH36_569g01004 [Paralvinella palmiformis]